MSARWRPRAPAPGLARQRSEAELAKLYRERDIQRARAAERDLSLPLQ
jgi:hypothetical protein